MTYTVTIALSTNMQVAAIERIESLESPHTPWPEVQPLPITVPTPTIKPAMSNTAGFLVIETSGKSPVIVSAITGASSTPAIKNTRHCQSAAMGGSSLLTIPLTPMTWPCAAIKSTAAKPIMAPPISASMYSCIVLSPLVLGHGRF